MDLPNLLLDLMTTVGTREVNNEAEFPRGMLDVLSLELSLLRLVRPRESLVEVKSSVDNTRNHYHTPTNRFQELRGNRT